MRAALTPKYGPPSVLSLEEVPAPGPGPRDLVVEVHASPVTAGDRRLRAADFPSFTAILGRLLIGVTRPRAAVQGTMFAGRVVAVGADVTRYAVGDDVFGAVDHGAYAERLVVSAEGPVAPLPAGFSYAEAAALPYGAGTARSFLVKLAAVKAGDKVCVVGASGGVGRAAVQLAKHLGAEVTAVCGRAGFDLVRRLGADHVVDYRAEDFARLGQRYDVIFDLAGASSFGRSKRALAEAGRYLTVYLSLGVLLRMAWTSVFRRRRAYFTIDLPKREDMEAVRALAEAGAVRPVIAQRFGLSRITAAHEAAERRPPGAVIVVPSAPAPARAVG